MRELRDFRFLLRRNLPSVPPHEQRKGNDRKDKQVKKKPQVAIVKVATTAGARIDTVEEVRIESQEPASKGFKVQGPEPGLDWNDKEGDEKERAKQALRSFDEEGMHASVSKRRRSADSRYQKEQVHKPVIHEHCEQAQRDRSEVSEQTPTGKDGIAHRVVVDVHHAEARVRQSRVEGRQREHDEKTQPVEVGKPLPGTMIRHRPVLAILNRIGPPLRVVTTGHGNTLSPSCVFTNMASNPVIASGVAQSRES